ncbi:hypothetical protein [Streptomyces sp. NPDC050856]|uniref:hypothetical protein n=1 Tax=Streptomyces sp. NPDC050856 TaxID=3154939 RepID=UPI0033D93116
MFMNTVARLLAPTAAVAASLASAPAHAAPAGEIQPRQQVAAAAPSARAAGQGSYSILVSHRALFVADFCLLSTTSGTQQAACSGDRALGTGFRLGVVHKPGERVHG